MKDYSNKYKYRCFTNSKGQRVIIAMSTYEGKVVRGIAKCDPGDEYVEKDGKKLAAARCNEKIATKRENRAKRKLAEAKAQLIMAQKHFADMENYYNDAFNANSNAKDALAEILKNM